MTTTEEFVANTAPRNETERTLQELPEQLNRLVRERTASLEQAVKLFSNVLVISPNFFYTVPVLQVLKYNQSV